MLGSTLCRLSGVFFSSGPLGVVSLRSHCYIHIHVLFWPNNLSNRKDEKSVWAGIRNLERYFPVVRSVGALVNQLLPRATTESDPLSMIDVKLSRSDPLYSLRFSRMPPLHMRCGGLRDTLSSALVSPMTCYNGTCQCSHCM